MSRYVPRFPGEYIETDPHDDPLGHGYYISQGAYRGNLIARDQYESQVRAIKQRGADGILGPKGVQAELEKLAREWSDGQEREYMPRLKKVRQTADETRATFVAPKVKASANMDEAVEAGLQRDRLIRRFEGMQPDQQRRFLESADAKTLRLLRNEPGLLSPTIASRIDLNSMRGHANFPAYEKLVGKHLPDGSTDALSSALDIAEFVVAGSRAWAYEVAGLRPSNADRLKEAGIAVDGERVVLSVEQSRDPELFRAAREVAIEAGKNIQVVGADGDSGGYTPAA